MDLSSILSGPIGAIFGAAGAIGQKLIDYKMRQLDHEHELAMRDKDMAQAKFEAESKFDITKLEGDVQLAVKDFDGISTSIQADRATYGDNVLGHIVDTLRGVTRPLLTFVSMFLVCHVTWVATKDGLNGEQVEQVLNEALFLSGVSIAWWFGTRPSGGKR